MTTILDALRNRKKLVLGLLAGAIVYVAAKAGLDISTEAAATIAGVIFAAVFERSQPIFGVDVDGPKVVTPPSSAPAADRANPPVVVEVRGEERPVGRSKPRQR